MLGLSLLIQFIMTKQYLKIQSNGEIEIEAFTLIGASSKRGDETKIGYFGSGLKYSIAAMLRNGISFKIFKGEQEIKFEKSDTMFRGENYEKIVVDGRETSLTVTMGGKDWDIPFAPIREIYSNALDEDEDASIDKSENVFGTCGFTTFFIEMNDDVRHFYENIELYFCSSNPNVLSSNNYATIYPKTPDGSLRMFRKGILCYHNEKQTALFSYNSKEFTINESRVLSAMYSAKAYIGRSWKQCTNKALIQELLNGIQGGNSGKFEHELEFIYESFSNEWYELCKDKKFIPVEMVNFCKPRDLENRMLLPKSLLLPLFRQFPDIDVLGLSEKNSGADYIIESEPSEILTDKVVDALAILSKTRYQHRLNDINIVYANFEEKSTLGLAEKGKIILSTRLEDDDVPYIAKIIIEENEHNRSGHSDETRNFQNHLFKLYYDELTAAK